MGRASGTDLSAEQADQQNADQQLGSADSAIAGYLGNVNSQLASGNPYESKDYLTQQNLTTSGAMNSENDAAKEAEGETVARTGTNSAALANEEAEGARQGERDMTDYNATRDTANLHDWEAQKEGLTRDQLAGASEYGALYGTSQGAANSALGDYTTAQDAEDKEWSDIAGSAIGAGGTALGDYLGK